MLPAFSVEYRLSVFVSIFADDIKIAAKLKSADDTQILQRAIDYLEKIWCNSNDLHRNISKCGVMPFSSKGTRILSTHMNNIHSKKSINTGT